MIVLLAVAAVVVLLVWLDRRDHARCDRINKPLVDMTLASRASRLEDCPPDFLVRVRAAMPVYDKLPEDF